LLCERGQAAATPGAEAVNLLAHIRGKAPPAQAIVVAAPRPLEDRRSRV
jgi:hypothetical protein